jgi:RNA polymerase sigma-70 factor (ECF subfamily)
MSSAAGYISKAADDATAAPRSAAAAVSFGWVTRLLDKEGEGVLRLLWRILGVEADVLDAYQDCFCKLATVAPGGVKLRNARAYLYRTASNIAIEMLRSRKRRIEHLPGIAEAHLGEDAPAAADAAAEHERIDQLRSAITRLSPHLQQVILLRDLGQLPYEDVGRILGIDPATARVYRRHAVVKLAEWLGLGDTT